MQDEQRSQVDLIAEVRRLRMRVAELELEHGPGSVRLQQLLDRIPGLMWMVDLDLSMTWWRGSGIDILGLDAEAQLGVTVYDFFETTNPEHPSIHAHRAALEGEARHFELEVGEKWWSASVEPLYGAGDIIRGVIGVAIEITSRVRAEHDRESLILKLQKALEDVKTLSGLIPICMHCKSMRDDRGYWQQVDDFVSTHSKAELSHGICPACMEEHLPGGKK